MKTEITKDILQLVDSANGVSVDFAPIITKYTEEKELTEQDSVRRIILNIIIKLYNDGEIYYPLPDEVLNIVNRIASQYLSNGSFIAATKNRIKEQQEKNPPYNDFIKQCDTVLKYLYEKYNPVEVLSREQVYLETGISINSPVYEYLNKRYLIKVTMYDMSLDTEGYALMSVGTNLAIAFKSALYSVSNYTDNSTHIKGNDNQVAGAYANPKHSLNKTNDNTDTPFAKKTFILNKKLFWLTVFGIIVTIIIYLLSQG